MFDILPNLKKLAFQFHGWWRHYRLLGVFCQFLMPPKSHKCDAEGPSRSGVCHRRGTLRLNIVMVKWKQDCFFQGDLLTLKVSEEDADRALRNGPDRAERELYSWHTQQVCRDTQVLQHCLSQFTPCLA